MKRYRSYKEHLIEKLKDSGYASAYLNACLEESFEAKDMGIFQLAVRDVVEANGGMAEISSKMEVSRESFYRNRGQACKSANCFPRSSRFKTEFAHSDRAYSGKTLC